MAARGLLLSIDYPPARGGISRLLEAWTADTNEVEWCVVTVEPGPVNDRILRSNKRRLLHDAYTKGKAWLRVADESVVVAGHPYLSGPALLIAASTTSRSACIAYGRELVPGRSAHRLAIAPMLAMHSVIAISSYTARVARSTGVRRSRLSVVRPVIQAPWRALTPTSRPLGTGLRLFAISRLHEGYKNLELLLRVCAVLHPLGVVDQLTIVGDGPRLGTLRAKVMDLGLDGIVSLPGYLSEDEIVSQLSTSHLGLFPSRHSFAEGGFEGFGLVVHELAAGGLPVLVSSAAGARDTAVVPWARLLDPDDIWAWVEAIENLYENESLRSTLSTAALEWANSIDPTESARQFASIVLGRRPSKITKGAK